MSKTKKIVTLLIICLMILSLNSVVFGGTKYSLTMNSIGSAAGKTVYKIGLNSITWFCGQHGSYLKTSNAYEYLTSTSITKSNYLAYIFSFYTGTASGTTTYKGTNILGGALKDYTDSNNYLKLQKIIWDSDLNLGTKYNISDKDTSAGELQSSLSKVRSICTKLENLTVRNSDKEQIVDIKNTLRQIKESYSQMDSQYGDDDSSNNREIVRNLNNIISYIETLCDIDLENRENESRIKRYATAIMQEINSINNILATYKETSDDVEEIKAEGKHYENYVGNKDTQLQQNDGHIYAKPEQTEKPLKVNNDENGEKYFLSGEYEIPYLYDRIPKSAIAGEPILLSGITDIEVWDEDAGERINPNDIKFITSEDYVTTDDGIHKSGYIINESEYPFPRDGEKFNIKIPYKEGRTRIKIKVSFQYLDSISSYFERQHFKAYWYHSGCSIYSDNYHPSTTDVQDLLKYKGSNYEWKYDSLELTANPIPDNPEWDFEITKRDADTEEFLEGVIFKISVTNQSTGEIVYNKTKRTDDDGKILIKDLPARRDKTDVFEIVVKEEEALDNYIKPETIKVIYVTIEDGNIVEKETKFTGGENFDNTRDHISIFDTIEQKVSAMLYNKIDRSEFTLQVIKIDKDTKNGLKGADFTIELYNKDTNTKEGTYNETTDRNGKITIKRTLEKEKNYRVILKEKSAPTGYNILYYGTSVEFSTDEDGYIKNNGKDIDMKQQQTSTSAYRTVNNKWNYLEVTNGKDSDRNLNYSELKIYIENKDKPTGRPGHRYYDEGYDIKLTKNIINAITGQDLGKLTNDSIEFNIVMKDKNGKEIKTWNRTTQDGEIVLEYDDNDDVFSKEGTFELWITENLTQKQKEEYSIIGNNPKKIRFEVKSTKKTVGRKTTTYYYIDQSSITITNGTSGIKVEGQETTIVDKIEGVTTLQIGIQNRKQPGVDTTIKIAGTVFEDGAGIKTNKNNLMDDKDSNLAGIEVTLLYADGTKVETKANGETLKNPIYTKSDGSYEFTKLDAMKKYKVKFRYNGQEYMATDYFKDTSYEEATDRYYNTTGIDEENLWESYSKAKENGRDVLNNRFATINNYIEGSYTGKNGVNTAYPKTTMEEVYDLIKKKIATDENLDNIEQYLKDNGIKDMTMDDVMQEKIDDLQNRIDDPKNEEDKEYLKAYIKNIEKYREKYREEYRKKNYTIEPMYTIASKLQYVEDCKIESITDVYPSLDKFVVSDKEEVTPIVSVDQMNGTYTSGSIFKPLYGNKQDENGTETGGIKQINFGVYVRPTVQLLVYEDVYNTTVSINNKTTVYGYNENGELYNKDNNKVQVYEEDYAAYEDFVDNQVDYRTYEQDVRRSDFATNSEGTDATNLAIYVKYKIEITNEQNSEVTINSLINHYDSRYFTYDGKCKAYIGNETAEQIGDDLVVEPRNDNGNYTKYGADSKYHQLIITLNDAQKKVLTTGGEKQYVYLTLKLQDGVSTSSALRSLLPGETDKSERLRNYTEVYSYSTNTTDAETKGLVDRLSIVGNFMPGTGINELDNSNAGDEIYKVVKPRTLAGNVYEDTSVTDASKITEPKKKENSTSTGIGDIKAELVELVKNSDSTYTEIVRDTQYTKPNGNYTFEGYIPGDYVVRFTYGIMEEDHDTISKTTANKSYNGQDYQSTYANPDTNLTQYWYAKNSNEQTLSVISHTYKDKGDDYSDAYDEVGARTKAINYATTVSMNNDTENMAINYYKSQVLKAGNVYNEKEGLKKALAENTAMTAYTSKLELEVEKANINQIYHNKDDLTYDINGIDFGLIRRAPSELTLEKKVKHILITQSDGTVLVNSDVEIENGKIKLVTGSENEKVHFQSIGTPNANGIVTAKLEIDDEILIGTIDITYEFTITNNTENTTLTYYKNGDNNVAIGYYTSGSNGYNGNEDLDQLVYYEDGTILKHDKEFDDDGNEIVIATYTVCDGSKTEDVSTQAVDIIDYVSNNLRFDSDKNSGWDLVTKNEESKTGTYYDKLFRENNKNSLLAAEETSDPTGIYSNISESVNTYNQILLATSGNELLTTFTKKGSVTYDLTLSTRQTTEVDLDYTNVAEIIQTTNSAGRVDASSIPGNLDPIKDYLVVYEKTNPVYFNSRLYNDNKTEDGKIYGLLKQTSENLYPNAKLGELKNNGKAFELDSTKAQQVSITDSTGDTHYYYLLIGSMLTIFALGIVGIKKFVLDKKK